MKWKLYIVVNQKLTALCLYGKLVQATDLDNALTYQFCAEVSYNSHT